MRQTFFGLAAAAALTMTASATPAMACGGGLFQSSCSPCGYVDPCAAPVYVAPVYSGCNTGCGGGGYGYGGGYGLGYGYGIRPRLGYGARFGYGGRLGYGGRFGYGGRVGYGYGGRFGRY